VVIVARTKAELREALAGHRGVGLVPTMGAFHAGHLSLFRAARAESELVVVSLFVNPAQFDSPEDLERYSRAEARDLALAEQAGVDIIFAPQPVELYPPGFQTWVEPGELGSVLEGAQRPGHFRGVLTVVLKLCEIVQPARAYFGAKDAQQAALVKQMVRDLDLPVMIRVLPTVRDKGGLALSSRNRLLSPAGYQRALGLPHALQVGARAHHTDEDAAAAARALLTGLEVDYVETVKLDGVLVLTAAIHVDGVRLIDNVVLAGKWQ
jgi:pantoate--beta-alanine ligase